MDREVKRIELDNGEAISIRLDSINFDTYIVLESKSGLTEYPTLYDDGAVAFDHPERYTMELKRKARLIMVQWRKRATGYKWRPTINNLI